MGWKRFCAVMGKPEILVRIDSELDFVTDPAAFVVTVVSE